MNDSERLSYETKMADIKNALHKEVLCCVVWG